MASAPELRARIAVCMFDQYGTVVDMQAGLTEAVTPYLRGKGWTGEPHALVTWWRRTHFENSMIDALCDRGHTPYRHIGHRAVSYVMDRCGIAHTQEEVIWLVSEIEKLKPFPDVVAALEKLRSKGYKLAILSNGDRDMLKAAGPHIGFPFDHVISVQEAGYFKPHWKTYAKAEEIIDNDRSSTCLLQIMRSTALAQSPTACEPRLSTAVSGHLAKHRISLISSSQIFPSWPPR